MRRPTHLRQCERLPLTVRVRYRIADLPDGLEQDQQEALAANLSEGGLFLRAPLCARLAPGTLLEIHLDAGRHGAIAALARVAHRRADGCGVHFEPLDGATATRLLSILGAGRRHLASQTLAQAQRHLTKNPRLV